MSRVFITAFVVGCLLGTIAVAADAPFKLHVSPAPDREADEIVVHSTGGAGPAPGAAAPATGAAATAANSTTVRLFVWQTGADKSVLVRLLGSLTPARGAMPTVKFLGESGTVAEQITVDAKGGHAIVTLQVEGLVRDGVFPGMLYWQYDGIVRPLIPLKVNRTSTPVLTVLGASGEKPTLAFQTESAAIAMPITIDSSGLSAVQDLRLSATPFVTKEGLRVDGKWSVGDGPMVGVSHEVAPRGSLGIHLQATFPVPGDYTSQLTLNYADQHQVVSVVVKRERKPAAIDILGLDKADGVVGWFRTAPSIWFSVAEKNGGRPVTLNMPQLIDLAQKVGASNTPQVSLQGATVWTAEGKLLKEPIELRSGETRWLRMELPGLTSAGEMTGKLRVGVVDHQPVDHSFSMVLKESACVAGLFIALGVALSFLTRIYQQQLKPRLEQQRVAASLREELDSLAGRLGALEADEQSILDGYRNSLSSIEDKLRVKADAALTAQLNAINRKLSLFLGWIQARRTIGALRGVRLPEEIQTKLNDLRAFLVSTRTMDEAAAATTATAYEEWLNGLRDRINDVWKKQLVDSIHRFREEIKEAQVVLPETVRNEILRFLAEADRALNNGQLAAAATAWEKSRSAFLIEQSRRFLTEVNEATPPPRNVSQEEWSVVTRYVVEELKETIRLADGDAESAGDRYHHAITRYLGTILAGLSRRAKEFDAQLDHEPAKSNPQNPEWKGRLKRDTLDRITLEGAEPTEMRRLLDGFQFDAVKRRYDEAQSALIRLELDVQLRQRDADQNGLEQMQTGAEGTSAADVVAAPNSFAWSAGTGTPQRAIRLLSTAEIDANLNFLQAAFSLVVLLIAVVLGLQLLWITKSTWGGGGDYITAFLWGLGLHKVSDTALDIGALLNRGK